MKKIVITIALASVTIFGFSQSEEIQKDKKTQFGFNLGGFQTFFKPEKDKDLDIKNSPGFRLGIVMNHKIGKSFSISPKAELGFSSSNINFTQKAGNTLSKPIYNTHLEFMSHFIWENTNSKANLYALIGPSIRIPLVKKDEVRITNNYDVGIDIGIGFNKKLPFFNVMPELRFSNGLTNIFESNTLPKTRFTSISLVLNFLG
jgi:hypothetical protein